MQNWISFPFVLQAGPIARRLIEVEKLAEEPSEIARMVRDVHQVHEFSLIIRGT